VTAGHRGIRAATLVAALLALVAFAGTAVATPVLVAGKMDGDLSRRCT
jgi:hypothetical protein